MVGSLTFTISDDSMNVFVADEHGLTMPLIVRDPRDPVYPVLPENPFTVWRNAMATRLLADTSLTNERIASMIADSLRQAGCINVEVQGAIVSYQYGNNPADATSWIIQRPRVVPKSWYLTRLINSLAQQLQSGRTVYVLWSGRMISCSDHQAQNIRSRCSKERSFTSAGEQQAHPDLDDLLRRPVNPTTLRQEVGQ
jgi:hypothetical protein